MNIGNVGATTYNTWTNRTNSAKAQENSNFENVADKKVMTCTAQGSNEVMLRSDALMSYASPQTGESVSIYRADNYSKENPMYIMKGLDANGNEFEKEVDASKIDPNHCSYNELMVLNVETGHTSPSDFLHAAALRSKANVNSYFEEADWISNAQALMKDWQTVGSWDSYLAMSKWLQSIMDYVGKTDDVKSETTACNDRGNSPAEQAFHNVAPNAPDSVKKAWMEAAEETGANGMGLMDNGKMSHISQLMVMKAVRRERGEENWSDVLGNSVGSALAAAKQALYQLENPLVPHSQRGGADVQAAIAKEKEFYISFIEKLETLQESSGRNNTAENASEDTAENLDYAQAIREKIEEIYEKVANGDTEQSFVIGAQSFTLEEWDEFLAKFDAAEEEIRKMQKEEIEKRTEQNMDTAAKSATEESTILTSESTMCTYPASDSDEEDIRYITWYTEEGIFCRKAGQTEGYEWTVPFENKEQYEKVMDFIKQFPADYNSRFAAHENFWTDYLNGEIDEEAFLNFMEGTDNGVPDYSVVKGDSVYFDRDKMQWAEYLNPLDVRIYTAEELQGYVDEQIKANQSKKLKLEEMLERSYVNARNMKYSFAGEDSIYTFDEFIDRLRETYFSEAV